MGVSRFVAVDIKIPYYISLLMNAIIERLLDLVYPRFCIACQNKITQTGLVILCTDCQNELALIKGPCCNRCGAPFDNPYGTCKMCLGKEILLSSSIALGMYYGVLRDIIIAFKFSGQSYIADSLGKLLAGRLLEAGFVGLVDLVIPVPVNFTTLLVRGYNQSALLAERVAKYIKKPVDTKNLYKCRVTRPQVGLQIDERMENVKGAFRLKFPKKVEFKNILLIDDVLTTGSTLNECARVLFQQGAKKVYAAVIARD